MLFADDYGQEPHGMHVKIKFFFINKYYILKNESSPFQLKILINSKSKLEKGAKYMGICT